MELVDEKTGLRLPNVEEKNTAMFTHLASFGSLIFPFGNIIGPLIVWSLKKDKSDFVDTHGKESINFEITYSIVVFIALAITVYFAVASGIKDDPLGIVMSVVGFIFPIIGYWFFALIAVIVGAVKASKGEYYKYPLRIRFIK
jgi:uncharacterized Tic20 family protein